MLIEVICVFDKKTSSFKFQLLFTGRQGVDWGFLVVMQALESTQVKLSPLYPNFLQATQ
jgi:hypothetical protein